MATYQTFRNGLPARVSRQFEEEYEQPIKYQVSSGQVDPREGWERITWDCVVANVPDTSHAQKIPFIILRIHSIERTSQVQEIELRIT